MIAAKLDIVSDAKIQENGIMALKESLGVTGMLKFLEQFDRGGEGNYTEETVIPAAIGASPSVTAESSTKPLSIVRVTLPPFSPFCGIVT